jgi:hypothetical protein
MKKIYLIIGGISTTLILFACSNSVYQFYEGPRRPVSEVSILTGYPPAYLLAIDGKFGPGKIWMSGYTKFIYAYNSRDFRNCFQVELEPGIHKLDVQYIVTNVQRGVYNTTSTTSWTEPQMEVSSLNLGKFIN